MSDQVRFAAVGSARVAYSMHGEGDLDIVYSPGLASHLDLTLEQPRYRRYIEALQRYGRVIRFDRRGTGVSDPVPADADETWEMWADDLAGVLDDVGSRRVAIIATNDAGPAAVLFAAAHPERVHALVLFNTTARFFRGDGYPEGHPPEVGTQVIAALRAGWGTDTGAAMLAPSLGADAPFRAWYQRFQRGACSPGEMAMNMQRLFKLDARGVLPEVRCPTLVLHRDAYAMLPVAHAKAIAGAIPGAQLEIVPGTDAPIYTQGMGEIVGRIGTFLGTSAAPAADERVFSVVLFTDIVSSTEQLLAIGDRGWSQLLDAHDALVRETIAHHQGNVIQITGDGVLASFVVPTRALRGAEALRNAMRGLGLDIRAGLHAGPIVRRDDGGISGVSVHVAARIQAEAQRGEILVSEALAALVTGDEFGFSDAGRRSLKGLPGEWLLHRVDPPAAI
jgi:class 3 adenylate cyclase/pimeloyl-ACP methyl ester carboxylesterase